LSLPNPVGAFSPATRICSRNVEFYGSPVNFFDPTSRLAQMVLSGSGIVGRQGVLGISLDMICQGVLGISLDMICISVARSKRISIQNYRFLFSFS
jgi:hypothetical protein